MKSVIKILDKTFRVIGKILMCLFVLFVLSVIGALTYITNGLALVVMVAEILGFCLLLGLIAAISVGWQSLMDWANK